MVAFATQVKRRRGTTAQNDAFTGAEGEIVVDTERHELRVHDGITRGGFKIGGGGSGRNIGDIFMTKRTDSGLSGAVECNGGTYNTTDYDGNGSIGELLETGKLDYISLDDYATAINTKGWCDRIGWNGAGTTSFKVPTLTPRIIQTNNIPVVGNGNKLQVTKNSDGETGLAAIWTTSSGAIGTNVTSASNLYAPKDPEESGIIADTSDTAQLRVMIQLTGGATDEAFATCSGVLADVAELKTITEGIIDYVVESQMPTEANGYTWYRKYKSGWVEQGGAILTADALNVLFTLPIEMATDTYAIFGNSNIYSNASGRFTPNSATTTSFTANCGAVDGAYGKGWWQVCGMAAQ